jgi:hypothetical protein
MTAMAQDLRTGLYVSDRGGVAHQIVRAGKQSPLMFRLALSLALASNQCFDKKRKALVHEPIRGLAIIYLLEPFSKLNRRKEADTLNTV